MKKYKIKLTKKFRKDLKKIKRRGYDLSKMDVVVELLKNGEKLPAKYSDHALSGEYRGCRECHITSDWLLIYELYNDELFLYLTRTGTHSDLF